MDYVNINMIMAYVKRGILNAEQPITIKQLCDVGLAKKVKHGIKILGKVPCFVTLRASKNSPALSTCKSPTPASPSSPN